MVPPLFLVKARAKGSTCTPSEVSRSGGVVKMNTETDQGISTSDRFLILMEVPQEDNFT